MKTCRYLLVLALSVGIATISMASEPMLYYERTHSLVAHDDSAFRLSVHGDGRVEAHFPLHSPQAGTHTWTVEPEDLQALLNLAAPIADISSDDLLESLQTQRSQHLIEVADADQVVLAINHATRGHNRVIVPSPELWQRHLPDEKNLGTVAEIASELAAWMRDQALERVR